MKKVFVSSPVYGLEALRDAAQKAIDDYGFRSVRSESFGARPSSSEKACFAEVEACDVFLLILGERYGFIPKSSPTSVTHNEFLLAKKLGKPILVFVQNVEADPKQKLFIEEIENFDAGFLRAKFSNADELKYQIAVAFRHLTSSAASREKKRAYTKDSIWPFILEAKKEVQQKIRNSEPMLVLGFMPDPTEDVNLSAAETDLKSLFTKLDGAGIVNLSNGFEKISGLSWIGLRSKKGFGDTAFTFHESGLSLLLISPAEESRDHTSVGHYYIRPEHIFSLATAFARTGRFQSGWACFDLSKMSMHKVADPPAGRSNSITLRSGGEDSFADEKLIDPFSVDSFDQWITLVIDKLKRRFS